MHDLLESGVPKHPADDREVASVDLLYLIGPALSRHRAASAGGSLDEAALLSPSNTDYDYSRWLVDGPGST
jgi:hypothetical protein